MARKKSSKQRSRLSLMLEQFSRKTTEATGTSTAFIIALLVIIAWIVTGPLFHFSDTWQLVINTGTTIVTFLMVFLIQNTQNRDAKALHLVHVHNALIRNCLNTCRGREIKHHRRRTDGFV